MHPHQLWHLTLAPILSNYIATNVHLLSHRADVQTAVEHSLEDLPGIIDK